MLRASFLTMFVLFGAACLGGASLLPLAAAQKPDPPPALKGKAYELRLIRLGNTFQALRFHARTGESWSMVGERYEKIPETGPVPAGDYDVTLVSDDMNWMAFRIDRVSGATWQLRGNRWNRVNEPEGKAQ
jgi:hypothetical protein